MATALQNRLVGTVILVALAVIFLPDLLDGEKKSNADLFVDVPARPSMQVVVKHKPFPQQAVTNAVSREVEIVHEQPIDEPRRQSANAQAAAPDKPGQDNALARQTVVKHDKQTKLQSAGWVLQLGSFRHQANVRILLDKLEAAGYRAFSRPVQTSSGTLTKVFVGPDVDKKKLQKALPHLKQVTNLQGKLTPFTVQ